MSASLDNIINAWLPDVVTTYGVENLSNLDLSNNQTIIYDQRFMITNNFIDPKCYQVTKVMDMVPQGIIKLTLKQDDFNENRDNIDLQICDYYTNEGNLRVDITPSQKPGVSVITRVDADGNLVDDSTLSKGVAAYFNVEFPEPTDPEWEIKIIGDDYSKEDAFYYTNLISITEFEDSMVAIKAAKAGSLSGKSFRLSVSDKNGNYYSYVDLEVV